jgi:hypothetical protein
MELQVHQANLPTPPDLERRVSAAQRGEEKAQRFNAGLILEWE